MGSDLVSFIVDNDVILIVVMAVMLGILAWVTR